MKKLYSFFLMMVLAMGLSVNAQDVTFDFQSNPWELPLGSGSGETAAAGDVNNPIAQDGVVLEFGKGTANQPPRMWTGPQLRFYSGNTLTIRPEDPNMSVRKVVFNCAASSYYGVNTTAGTLEGSEWTGNHTEVTFTGTKTNRWNSVVVTIVEKDGETVSPGVAVTAPAISPRNNTNRKDSVVVTITGDSATTIYYTTNGDEPSDETTLYVAPFTLYESATVKAIAYDESGNPSAVTSVTYTIEKSEADTTGTVTPDTTAAATGLRFVPATAVESGKRYLIVADGNVAKPIANTKNYGYLQVEKANAQEDGSIVVDNDDNAFVFTAVDNSFTIQQKDGRYLNQKGTYDSFNVDTLAVDGSNWVVSFEEGKATITNTSVQKFVQYSTKYSSFGSYAESADDRVLPVLFVEAGEVVVTPDTTGTVTPDTTAAATGLRFVPATAVESGKRYLIVADGNVAKPIANTKNYGYLQVEKANAQEDGSIVVDNDDNAFVFTAVDNSFTIQQKDGRYLNQKGTYDSFNVDTLAVDGSNWVVSFEEGKATITNTSVQKFVQYSTKYSSFGSYAESADDRVLPVLFVEAGEVVVTPDTTTTENPDTVVNVYSNDLAEQGDMIVEEGTLPEGLTYVWGFSARYGAKASAYVGGANYAVETWLKTPVIDLATLSKPTFTFEQCISKFFGNVSEEATLWVREATEASTRLKEGDDWKQIVISYPELNGNWSAFEAQVIDLSEYAGKKVQIGFRYTSTETAAGTWEIKNISVGEATVVDGVQPAVVRPATETVIFDLSGRRVSKAGKGLYIINGKKVLVK